MVIKLDNKHEKILKDYLYQEKDWNLFMIGDYENYGIEKDFQIFWGEIDNNNKLTGVLMKYYENFVFSSITNNFDAKSFANIIKSYDYKIISGKEDVIIKFKNILNPSSEKNTYYARLDNSKYLNKTIIDNYNIVRCEYKDENYLKEIVNLTNSIEEFSVDTDYDRIVSSLKDKSGRAYALILNDNVVSAAQITAENSSSAMIIAVCTDNEHRGRGFATVTVTKLCDDLLNDGKVLCLFYDNPVAGNIYKRIGFKDIGKWLMLIK